MKTAAYQKFDINPFFFMLLFLVLVLFATIVICEHARTSHAEHAEDARKCFQKNGGTWYEQLNGRWIQTCISGGRKNFHRIYECKNGILIRVTEFPQTARKTLKYLIRKTVTRDGDPVPIDPPTCGG